MSFKRPKLADFPYFPEGVKKSDLFEFKEISPGCHKPDCIPSIDNPIWIDGARCLEKWSENEEILVLFILEEDNIIDTYAFPITILDYHEIVNFDTSIGKKVAMTYCPLCQTATAYNRILGEDELLFGVSGLLLNSALVLYDRNSNSLFSQVWSRGIVGKYTDKELFQLPFIQTNIKNCLEVYPSTKFLSSNTGSTQRQKRYGKYPYGEYKNNDQIHFPIKKIDTQMHPKTLVHVLEEKFVNNDSTKVFIFKINELSSSIQHNDKMYSIPHAREGDYFLLELFQNREKI
ncbi:MAG: hypothetical protein HeimC2_40700 [Candidatus Heimdallarchaeota archaeon LC_2]|nr:MAG: hypothetical protein HeimC2_40700 [Candidatus Heimdallarchaeota archaeon LC_2]